MPLPPGGNERGEPSGERLVLELSAAHEGAGGKARGLARLIGAGIEVPPGFALTAAAFRAVVPETGDGPRRLDELGHAMAEWARAAETRELPAALEREVIERARALGERVIVRSSMSFEDAAAGAAPGLGATVARVPAADVWTAIRAVWAASLTPLVALYARGQPIGAPGVVVQRWIEGERVTVFTRAPGRPDDDEVWIDGDGGAHGRVTRAREDVRVRRAIEAERAIGAERGADVELVGDVVVQARPLVHPAPREPRVPPPPFLLAGLEASGKVWRRDVTHNPDPMSVAQAGLCARVDPDGLAVVAGYLYVAQQAPPPADGPASAVELETAFQIAAAEVDEILSGAEGKAIAEVLDAYARAYRILHGELAPVIAAARRRTAHVTVRRRPSSIAAVIAQAAHGEIGRQTLVEIVGDSAPAWDVACPTFAETPELIDAAVLRAMARPPAEAEPDSDDPTVLLARAAADAAERDDLLFARAQATVRRALLGFADRVGLARADVFWLPLDELVDDLDVGRAAGRASAARAAAQRAARWDMPLTIGEPPAVAPAAGGVWHGSGLGGRAAGPAVRQTSLAEAPVAAAGAIVVTPAVTPAMALLVEGAAAIVCEHGSLLDHGAAMARELGIPCVVGCAGIVDAVADGEWLEVDGDSGRVTRR